MSLGSLLKKDNAIYPHVYHYIFLEIGLKSGLYINWGMYAAQIRFKHYNGGTQTATTTQDFTMSTGHQIKDS
jgi:hypothetical protein